MPEEPKSPKTPEETPEPNQSEAQAPPPGGNQAAGAPPPPRPENTIPPPPSTPSPPPAQSPNRTIMLILAYLGILALIPLLVEKEDQEVQWHAKHGLVLTVTWIVLWIVLAIIGMIPVVGTIIGCGLTPLLGLAILGLHIFLMVQAINGQKVRLPVVSEYADKWQ